MCVCLPVRACLCVCGCCACVHAYECVSSFDVFILEVCITDRISVIIACLTMYWPDFSLRLEKNFDARLIGRVPIYMVHIGSIYLVIRTQNKAEVSI